MEALHVFLHVHIYVSAACRWQYHGDWQGMFTSSMLLQIYQTGILLPECYLSILIWMSEYLVVQYLASWVAFGLTGSADGTGSSRGVFSLVTSWQQPLVRICMVLNGKANYWLIPRNTWKKVFRKLCCLSEIVNLSSFSWPRIHFSSRMTFWEAWE